MMCKTMEFKEFHVDILLGCFRTDGEQELLKSKVKKLKEGDTVDFSKEEYEVLVDLACDAWREDEMIFNADRYYSGCYAKHYYNVSDSLCDGEYYNKLMAITEALSDLIDILGGLINE